MARRRGTDLRVEHRREKARDEGEDRRIRPAGLFAHQKSLVPQKGSKYLMSAIARTSPSARVWRQNHCSFNDFPTLRATRLCTIGRRGIGTVLKKLSRPLGKISVIEPARRHQSEIKMFLAHFLGRPGRCPRLRREPGIEIETVFFLEVKADERRH